MSKKWQECSRAREMLPKQVSASEGETQPRLSGSVRARPNKPFEKISVSSKKRRMSDLVANRTLAELQFAADTAARYLKQPTQEVKCLTSHQAQALAIDLDLSDRKCKVLGSVINGIHKDCIPRLYSLKKVTKSLLPTNLTVSEISAEVDLQNLLNLTARSILKMSNIEGIGLKLICKWGFDGSSSHNMCKQVLSDNQANDEYMFLIVLVPLRLIVSDTGRECWVNKRTSSTLCCRPIKFIFVKENPDVVRREEAILREKVNGLQDSKIKGENDEEYTVIHELIFTMIDGSVVNVLSGTNATANCYICGATPKQMNGENIADRPSNTACYCFGLSSLHCLIRFFECLLHIAYKLPIQSWQARGAENKRLVEDNKKRIQALFKSKMGLIVDKSKPGYGFSNDGNTARRLFLNPELSSEITRIELIRKFSIIVKVIASGCEIDLPQFKLLLQDSSELYLSLYKWYYMPVTVHKILNHGCDIIGSFDLPIGQLSEDALEARHKEVKQTRLSHTRKSSRTNSNRDLMNHLLLTSEPLISSQRKTITQKNYRIDDEVFKKYVKELEHFTAAYDLDANLLDVESSDDDSSSETD